MSCDVAEVVTEEYLRQELQLGRLIKLSEEGAAVGVHCSLIGVIPKKHKQGKWRLIVDLSSPEGASVNDGVNRDMRSVSYTSVDIIAEKVASLGLGTLMGKMDIKQAYRMVPVHLDDRHLLGMRWQRAVYINKVSIWSAFGISDFYSSDRHPTVDDGAKWGNVCRPLLG